MIQTFRINTIRGREILDSRGNPTIEVEVKLCKLWGEGAENPFPPERLRGRLKQWNCETVNCRVTVEMA